MVVELHAKLYGVLVGEVSWGRCSKETSKLKRVFFRKLDICGGCKHSKVDQTSAPVYKSCGFLGQALISSSKMLFEIGDFS